MSLVDQFLSVSAVCAATFILETAMTTASTDTSTPRTIAGVIEAHRVAVGASEVRVTLGPDATPEALATALAKLQEQTAAYDAFTEAEKLQERLARQRDLFAQIRGKTGVSDTATREDLAAQLREIFLLADWLVDAVLPDDTDWMAAQRERAAARQV